MQESSLNPILKRHQQVILSNYAPPPINLVRGRGSRVWDDANKEYLDFTSGIAVNTLGHSHPAMIEALEKQSRELIHVSNLFAHPGQGALGRKIVDSIAPGKVFFCNSGAEANEALLKLSRLYGREQSGEEGKKTEVIVAQNAFHGRTFGGMSATPQEKIQGGFRPLLSGFKVAQLNDIASVKSQVTEQTAAIFIETVQGEGGVFPAEPDFLQALRQLCDQEKILLMLDEVQCGMGRSGWMWAFERAKIVPDAVGMAKGIGGGFPLGAIWIREPFTSLFKPGSHGTTYGGSPLASAVSLAVWDTIEKENLLENVRQRAEELSNGLGKIIEEFPEIVEGQRGLGLLRGLIFRDDVLPWVPRFREKGLLLPPAGNRAIRYIPALNVTSAEIAEALDITRCTFAAG